MKRFTTPLIATLVLAITTLTVTHARAAETDLKLFEKGTDWTVVKNGGGDGSFALATDGDLPIGVLTYDFAGKAADKPATVVAVAKTSIAEGPSALQVNVRSSRGLPVVFRLIDSSGQTHQLKSKAKGNGDWETLTVKLNGKFESWGGAKDGKIHYPIKQVKLSISPPKGDPPTGKVEFAKAVAVTE